MGQTALVSFLVHRISGEWYRVGRGEHSNATKCYPYSLAVCNIRIFTRRGKGKSSTDLVLLALVDQ